MEEKEEPKKTSGMPLIQELEELRREVAELKQWKALRQENHGHNEVFQNALLRASRAILEYGDFKTMARAIFDACTGLLGGTFGYVALLSDDGSENEVLFLEAVGRPCTVDPELPMPIRGLRGEVYRTGRAAYENSISPCVDRQGHRMVSISMERLSRYCN